MSYGSGNSGDYKKLKGQTIQVTDTDPVAFVGAWSSGGSLNTTRHSAARGTAGIQTAAIATGGTGLTAKAEQYDGSSWSEETEINTARRALTGFGATNTASLVAAGFSTAATDLTEVWDGSSWTEVGDQNAAKIARGGTGTVTAGILFGGTDPSTNTETWNGTAWTEVSELNTAGEYRTASGTAAEVLAAGSYPLSANVESWNGTSWTEINNISTARWEGAGTGSSTLGLIAGGHPGTPNSYATATEEFSFSHPIKTVTTS